MQSEIDGATIAELIERMESDAGYFYKSDPVVGILVERFRGMIPTLIASSDSKNTTLHLESVLKCCRLARRIRLRLGNPRKVSDQQRHEIAELFREAVKVFDTTLDFDDSDSEELQLAQRNISDRANRIEHAEDYSPVDL